MPAPATDEAAPPVRGAALVASYALVLVLTLVAVVWGSFLVPLRVLGTHVPVSLLLALSLYGLARAGGRLLGPLGAVVPGVLWLGTAVTLGSRRPEGDVVVGGVTPGSRTTALVFLVVGLFAAVAAYGVTAVRSRLH